MRVPRVRMHPKVDHQLESRMRESRQSGSEGGGGHEASPYPYRWRRFVRIALSGPPELRDHEQHAEVADDVDFHVEDALLVGFAAVGDVEAAAVDGVVAEQIDGDGDDEDRQQDA